MFASLGDGEDNGIGGFSFKSCAFAAVTEGTTDSGSTIGDWRIVAT